MIHQGFTRHGATYWVGANALLRTEALRDIRSVRIERGHPVPVFIQDRTVIEDTESSVDLMARGWSLYNYPDRLSWSATPPDFGSLVVQRDRWANGGLLILPKLLRHYSAVPANAAKLAEAWLRCHYLISIAAVNLSLLALLLWPFESALRSIWFPAAALSYFALYTRDLVRLGYPARDMLHAYSLNLLLLPVHLGAVWKSLRQGLTGRRTPFGRTPKVPGETPAPTVYHLAEYALAGAIGLALLADIWAGRWFHATFLMLNGAALVFALIRFVGWRQTYRAFRIPIGGLSRSASPAPVRQRCATGERSG
jgi:cellulose synthase/poly-beta-1,6-N-acetylglucosamine synthase-like glycosyltransferase